MKIHETKDYDIFNLLDTNRPINQNHLQRLIASIRQRNKLEMDPIRVNMNMEVIDGQHRLMAAKYLKVPIYYIVDTESENDDIILANSVKRTWKSDDYINYHVKSGNKVYIRLKDFMVRHGCTGLSALSYFGKIHCRKDLNFGKIKISEQEFAAGEQLALIMKEICDLIVQLRGITNVQFIKNYRFMNALCRICRHPDFDIDIFKQNIGRREKLIVAKTTESDYFDCLVNIYNFNLKHKLDFYL